MSVFITKKTKLIFFMQIQIFSKVGVRRFSDFKFKKVLNYHAFFSYQSCTFIYIDSVRDIKIVLSVSFRKKEY